MLWFLPSDFISTLPVTRDFVPESSVLGRVRKHTVALLLEYFLGLTATSNVVGFPTGAATCFVSRDPVLASIR